MFGASASALGGQSGDKRVSNKPQDVYINFVFTALFKSIVSYPASASLK